MFVSCSSSSARQARRRRHVHPHVLGVELLRTTPTQQRADAGQQLGQPERLGDVVVGAGVQADDGVHLVGPGGQDQHRQTRLGLPEPAADLEPVHLGQAEVEHHELHLPGGGDGQGAGPVGLHLDLVALPAQRAGERFTDRGIVLGKQHGRHARRVKDARSEGVPVTKI